MSWLAKLMSAIALAFGLNGHSNAPKVIKPPSEDQRYQQIGLLLTNPENPPEVIADADGKIMAYKVVYTIGERRVPVYFRLSEDGGSLTITAELSPIGDIKAVSAGDLAAVLKQNNLGESPFVVGLNENDVLTLQCTLAMRQFSEQSFDDLLGQLLVTIGNHEDLLAFGGAIEPPMPLPIGTDPLDPAPIG